MKNYWKEICVGIAGIAAVSTLWNSGMNNLEKAMKERMTAESEIEMLSNAHFIITNNRNYYLEYNRGWIVEASTEEGREELGLYMMEKEQEDIKTRSREITDYIIDRMEKKRRQEI